MAGVWREQEIESLKKYAKDRLYTRNSTQFTEVYLTELQIYCNE